MTTKQKQATHIDRAGCKEKPQNIVEAIDVKQLSSLAKLVCAFEKSSIRAGKNWLSGLCSL